MESRHKRIRLLVTRWALYTVALLCAAALQTMPGFLTIGECKPYFILAVCLAVAVCEDEFHGALFACVGGLLWDYTAGRTAGLLAIGLLMLAFLVSVVVQLYLTPSWVNFLCLTLAAGFLILSMDFLFFYLMRGYAYALQRYLLVVLPEVLLSAIVSPLALMLVRRIQERFALPE